MQRPFVFARGDFGIGLLRLRQCDIVKKRDHAIQLGVVLVQAGQVHLRQLGGSNLARLNQLRELRDGPEGRVFQVCGPLHRGRTEVERLARTIDLHAGRDGAEVELSLIHI